MRIARGSNDKASADRPFAGYFLPYPEQDRRRKCEGLVSTINDAPPAAELDLC
jgi:hypothetical protein